jgi:hypothetical protein
MSSRTEMSIVLKTELAVTIDKGADSKQNELQGWKARARNLKHL